MMSKQTFHDKNNGYTVVALYAGAGGLDEGLSQAGLSVGLAIELNTDACATFAKNHPNTVVWCRDVRKVTGKEIRAVVGDDAKIILTAGNPCQSFSQFQEELRKAEERGVADERGQLIFETLRIAKELQPEFFVFENVKNIIEEHREDFLAFKTAMEKATNLLCEFKLVNAIDYGVAQLRERVILIGSRAGATNPLQLLQPIQGPRTLREQLAGLPITPSPDDEYATFSDLDAEVMKQIPPGSCWNVLPVEQARRLLGRKYLARCSRCKRDFLPQGDGKCPKCGSTSYENVKGKYTSIYRRLSWEKPCYTVCKVLPTKIHGSLAHPSENRGISVREAARIQGFPATYEFIGSMESKYAQIGNAVPVTLGKQIGLAICESIKEIPDVAPFEQRKKDDWLGWIDRFKKHPHRDQLTPVERYFLNEIYRKAITEGTFPEQEKQKYPALLEETLKRLG